jgi:hypothetical protein
MMGKNPYNTLRREHRHRLKAERVEKDIQFAPEPCR